MVTSESPAIGASRPPGAGKRRTVYITGRGADVAFNLDEDAPLDQVALELGAQLAGQRSLFSKGGISVNTGRRNLSDDEEAAIRRIFLENSGLNIARFVSSEDGFAPEHGRDHEEPPSPRRRRRPESPAPVPSDVLARVLTGLTSEDQRNRNRAMLIRGTFRSGESLLHPGDVVVLGDVNPGSEIVADGDIVVMGALKGLPHAGASGDDKAAIVALEIASPRIRIGGCEAVAAPSGQSAGERGRKGKSTAVQPRIAYVRRKSIYVSPFAGRFTRYTKGVPYEG